MNKTFDTVERERERHSLKNEKSNIRKAASLDVQIALQSHILRKLNFVISEISGEISYIIKSRDPTLSLIWMEY